MLLFIISNPFETHRETNNLPINSDEKTALSEFGLKIGSVSAILRQIGIVKRPCRTIRLGTWISIKADGALQLIFLLD